MIVDKPANTGPVVPVVNPVVATHEDRAVDGDAIARVAVPENGSIDWMLANSNPSNGVVTFCEASSNCSVCADQPCLWLGTRHSGGGDC